MNFLDKEVTQPPKFRTETWVKTNDDARRMYNTNIQIKFKATMLKSSLCHHILIYAHTDIL